MEFLLFRLSHYGTTRMNGIYCLLFFGWLAVSAWYVRIVFCFDWYANNIYRHILNIARLLCSHINTDGTSLFALHTNHYKHVKQWQSSFARKRKSLPIEAKKKNKMLSNIFIRIARKKKNDNKSYSRRKGMNEMGIRGDMRT